MTKTFYLSPMFFDSIFISIYFLLKQTEDVHIKSYFYKKNIIKYNSGDKI